MRATRVVALVLLLVAVAAASWWFFGRHASGPSSVVVYYVKATDGTTTVPWTVSLGPARDPRSVAFYAAVQAVAGPPAGVDAVRFPSGTTVESAKSDGSGGGVDLSSSCR